MWQESESLREHRKSYQSWLRTAQWWTVTRYTRSALKCSGHGVCTYYICFFCLDFQGIGSPLFLAGADRAISVVVDQYEEQEEKEKEMEKKRKRRKRRVKWRRKEGERWRWGKGEEEEEKEEEEKGTGRRREREEEKQNSQNFLVIHSQVLYSFLCSFLRSS